MISDSTSASSKKPIKSKKGKKTVKIQSANNAAVDVDPSDDGEADVGEDNQNIDEGSKNNGSQAGLAPALDEDDRQSVIIQKKLADQVLAMKALQEATKLWVEYSKDNLEMFSKTAFEYSICAPKREKQFLSAVPIIEGSDNFQDLEKPTRYSICTWNKGAELVKLRFKFGGCCSQAISVIILANNVKVAIARQNNDLLIISKPKGGGDLLKIRGIPLLGDCRTPPPDKFAAHVYLPGETEIVGTLGRNGSLPSEVVLGEPHSFYYVSDATDGHVHNLATNIKLYLLALMVALLTQYAE